MPVAATAAGGGRRLLSALLDFGALFTASKSFRNNAAIGSRTANRLGLHVVRVVVAHAVMGLRMRLFGLAVPAADRRVFFADGILIKPDFLPPEHFRRIRDEVFAYDGRIREFVEGEARTRRAIFDDADRAQAPATLALETYKPLARLMAMADGGAPPTWSVECIVHGANDPQTVLHSDTFHPSAKCWLYLDDVGPEAGPFVYATGSHRLTWRRLVWEYRRSLIARDLHDGHSEDGSFRADAADLAALGLGAATPRPVRANTLVVANTYGFHQRTPAPAGARRRAIYAFARSNPFLPAPLPPVGVAGGLLRRARRRYFAWQDRETVAGRVPGRSVFHGPLDR